MRMKKEGKEVGQAHWVKEKGEKGGGMGFGVEYGKAIGEKGPSLMVIPIDYNENRLLSKKLGEISQII